MECIDDRLELCRDTTIATITLPITAHTKVNAAACVPPRSDRHRTMEMLRYVFVVSTGGDEVTLCTRVPKDKLLWMRAIEVCVERQTFHSMCSFSSFVLWNSLKSWLCFFSLSLSKRSGILELWTLEPSFTHSVILCLVLLSLTRLLSLLLLLLLLLLLFLSIPLPSPLPHLSSRGLAVPP
jgi:hypothetical protein